MESNDEVCTKCGRNFKSKRSLAQHNRKVINKFNLLFLHFSNFLK